MTNEEKLESITRLTKDLESRIKKEKNLSVNRELRNRLYDLYVERKKLLNN